MGITFGLGDVDVLIHVEVQSQIHDCLGVLSVTLRPGFLLSILPIFIIFLRSSPFALSFVVDLLFSILQPSKLCQSLLIVVFENKLCRGGL